VTILLFSAIHIGAHIENIIKISQFGDNALLQRQGLDGDLFSHPSIVTGYLLTAVLLVMAITSIPSRLKQNLSFEVFYYSHHAYIAYYILLALHGSFCFVKKNDQHCGLPLGGILSFVPVFLYTCERIVRLYQSGSMGWFLPKRKFCSFKLSKVYFHTSDVIELQITPPISTRVTGRYIMINIPKLSFNQWHPFSVTSCSGTEYTSVHIQLNRSWTRRLGELLGYYTDKNIRDLTGSRTEALESVYKDIRINVQGPYATATEGVFDYEVAVLIGAGIGVTPMSSLLAHIRQNYKTKGSMKRLKRVYFIWSSRKVRALEWFGDLISELDKDEDLAKFLTIQIFMTSKFDMEQLLLIKQHAIQRPKDAELPPVRRRNSLACSLPGVSGYEDPSAVPISPRGSLKLDLEDPITGLISPTFYGRPNWLALLQDIAARHPAHYIGVFYCGPHRIQGAIQTALYQIRSDSKSAQFVFHKENF
jgi:ferredoxin-NADP reductase